MKQDHTLVQFKGRDDTQVSAYQFFKLNVKMIHSFVPHSRIYFVCSLDNATYMFEDCYALINNLQPLESKESILPLTTQDGTFALPSIYADHEVKPIILYSFALDLSLEQMSYSLSPYETWRPIEARQGNMLFPLQQSILHNLPSIQHRPPNTQIQ